MTTRAVFLLLSGVAIAFVGAVCGIGGGLFAVPLLHYVFRLPLRPAVATSLCLVAATASTSTVTELLHENSAFLWDIVLPLVGGALVGAQFGYMASKKLDETVVKSIFAVVMLGVGLRMLLTSGVNPEPSPFFEAYSFGRAATVAGVGMLAGTVSPLLGIGGGLVVVPGLLLAMPEIGGLGARAASLGVAVVTSLRSIQLYARERAIQPAFAIPIAMGALVGASVGVRVVHMPGVSQIGQKVLGGILVLTAARFVSDVRRLRQLREDS